MRSESTDNKTFFAKWAVMSLGNSARRHFDLSTWLSDRRSSLLLSRHKAILSTLRNFCFETTSTFLRIVLILRFSSARFLSFLIQFLLSKFFSVFSFTFVAYISLSNFAIDSSPQRHQSFSLWILLKDSEHISRRSLFVSNLSSFSLSSPLSFRPFSSRYFWQQNWNFGCSLPERILRIFKKDEIHQTAPCRNVYPSNRRSIRLAGCLVFIQEPLASHVSGTPPLTQGIISWKLRI